MTAQSEALDRLIAAVEVGDAEIVGPFLSAMGMNSQNSIHAMNAYSGSLDAAKALHDALLPGWFIVITRLCDEFDADTLTLTPTDWRADVSDGWRGWPDDEDPEAHFFSADNACPARAWLLAVLRAYRTTLQ